MLRLSLTIDEGTAIFKVTDTPPVGEGVQFMTYEGLPSDHYLRLTGLAGKVIRGEIPVDDYLSRLLPARSPVPTPPLPSPDVIHL